MSLQELSEDKALPKREKGKSHSLRPVSKRPPSWCRYEPEEVEAVIIKLAREGHSASKIGTILRDQFGVPLAKPIVGKSITNILKEADMTPPMPEDFGMLLKKASKLSTHLEKNKMDLVNKRSLHIVEARIYKLSRYYKRKGVLPTEWKYKPRSATVL